MTMTMMIIMVVLRRSIVPGFTELKMEVGPGKEKMGGRLWGEISETMEYEVKEVREKGRKRKKPVN